MANPNTRKSCVVPKCKNTTTNAPDKLFFIVPKDVQMRKKWIKAMKRLDPFGDKSTVYCCEDHFDLKEDMDNYIKYKLVGGKLKLKQGTLPHKFECQKPSENKNVTQWVKKRSQYDNASLRRVTWKQLESLYNILAAHQDIVVGDKKSTKERQNAKRMWMTVAKTLNSQGISKDWKGWSKYWTDYKGKLKKKVAYIARRANISPSGKRAVCTLSDVQKKFLDLLETNKEDTETKSSNTEVEPLENLCIVPKTEPDASPSTSSDVDHEDDEDEDIELNEDPLKSEVRLSITEGSPSPASGSESQNISSRDEAIRSLQEVSKTMLELAQQNSSILKQMAETQQKSEEILRQVLFILNRVTSSMD